MGKTMKRLGCALAALALVFGVAVVPGGGKAYADNACAVSGGEVNISGGTLCVMNEAVTTINYSGIIGQLGDMLYAFEHNVAYGYGTYASDSTIKATISDVFSDENVIWLSGLMTSYNETVELTPAAGDYVVTNTNNNLPAGYSINYDNVVVHLPAGTSVLAALGSYMGLNNTTATVAVNNSAITVNHSNTYGIVVHLAEGTSVEDGLAVVESVGEGVDYVLASGMDYWMDVVDGDADVFVLSADALTEALGLVDTVYVNYDMTVATLTIPEGKTVIENSATLTITDLANSSIEGTFEREDGEDYYIVKLGNVDEGVVVTLTTEDGVLVAPALVQAGTEVTASAVPDAEHANLLACVTAFWHGCSGSLVVNEDTEISAILYDVVVTPGENDEIEDANEATVTANFMADQIKDIIRNGGFYNGKVWFPYGDILPFYFANGGTLNTELRTLLIDEADWADWEEDHPGLMAAIGENETPAAFYDAYLLALANIGITIGDDQDRMVVGEAIELDEAVTMRLEIPEAYREAPLGYTRNFTIIAEHWGIGDEEPTITRITPTRDGNYLVFLNSEFSSFAIVYEDVLNPVITPDTGVFTDFETSGNAASASMGGLAVISILGIAVVLTGIVKFTRSRK